MKRLQIYPISWLACAMATLPIAIIANWVLSNLMSAQVESKSALFQVPFGWPYPWIWQDQSRYEPIAYPMSAKVSWNKVDPLPTEYDWLVFAADSVIIWLLLSCILWGLISLLSSKTLRKN